MFFLFPLSFSLFSPISYSKFFLFSRTLMLIVICKTNISQFAPCGHKLAMQNDILLLAWKLYKAFSVVFYDNINLIQNDLVFIFCLTC